MCRKSKSTTYDKQAVGSFAEFSVGNLVSPQVSEKNIEKINLDSI